MAMLQNGTQHDQLHQQHVQRTAHSSAAGSPHEQEFSTNAPHA
jgi:hypothetical protein